MSTDAFSLPTNTSNYLSNKIESELSDIKKEFSPGASLDVSAPAQIGTPVQVSQQLTLDVEGTPNEALKFVGSFAAPYARIRVPTRTTYPSTDWVYSPYNNNVLWSAPDELSTPVASLGSLRFGYLPSTVPLDRYQDLKGYVNPQVREDTVNEAMMHELEQGERYDRLAIYYPYINDVVETYKERYGNNLLDIAGEALNTGQSNAPNFGFFMQRRLLGDKPIIDPNESFIPIQRPGQKLSPNDVSVHKLYREVITSLDQVIKSSPYGSAENLFSTMKRPDGIMGNKEIAANLGMMAASTSILRHLYLYGPVNMPVIPVKDNFMAQMIECLDRDYSEPLSKYNIRMSTPYGKTGEEFNPTKFAKYTNPMIVSGRPNGEMFMVTETSTQSMVPGWVNPLTYEENINQIVNNFIKSDDPELKQQGYDILNKMNFVFTNDTVSLYTGMQYLHYRKMGYTPNVRDENGNLHPSLRKLTNQFEALRDYNLRTAYLLTQAGTLFESYGMPNASNVNEMAEYDKLINTPGYKSDISARNIYSGTGLQDARYDLRDTKIYNPNLSLKQLANYHMEMARHFETLRFIYSGGEVKFLERTPDNKIVTRTATFGNTALNAERLLFLNTMANAAGTVRYDSAIPLRIRPEEVTEPEETSKRLFESLPDKYIEGIKEASKTGSSIAPYANFFIGVGQSFGLPIGYMQGKAIDLNNTKQNLIKWRNDTYARTGRDLVNELFKELYGKNFDEFINSI